MKSRKLEGRMSKRDVLLWSGMVVGFVLGICLDAYFPHPLLAVRLTAWIMGMLVLSGLFFCTTLGQRFWVFLQASRVELRKIVWPTRQETVRTTLVVIVAVSVTGVLLWVVDSTLSWAIAFFTR